MNNEKLAQLRYELTRTPELCQFDLLTPRSLCQFANDRAVPVFNAATVEDLWRIGLLRADLITARSMLQIPSVQLVEQKEAFFTYCDLRRIEHRAQGYGGIIARKDDGFDSIELLFHPFRLY